MKNIFSTELNEDFEYPEKPEDSKHLRWMMISAILLGIVPLALCIAFADRIDSFMDTEAGFNTAWVVIGILGIAWFIWRIKKMLE